MTERGTWTSFDDFAASRDDDPITENEKYVSYSLEDLWPAWQKKGRCYSVGLEYFFGIEEQQPAMSIKQVRRASKLCEVCPVYTECLTWALENNEEYGVWAGTSGRTRRKIQQGLDSGSYTIPEVVEDFINGRGSKYTQYAGSRRGDPGRSSQEQSSRGLRAEDRRVHAAGDR